MDTAKLATDAHALAVKLGMRLMRAENLCQEGKDWNGKELAGLAAEINMLMGMVNAIYWTAKETLSEDDFNQFVYRCGIKADLISEGVDKVNQAIIKLP